MKVRTHRRPPQGAHSTRRIADEINPLRIAQRDIDVLDELPDSFEGDPLATNFYKAALARDEKKMGAAIRALKAKYPKEWPAIARHLFGRDVPEMKRKNVRPAAGAKGDVDA